MNALFIKPNPNKLLNDLAHAYLAAKQHEDNAKAARLEAEAKILDMLTLEKDEGVNTFNSQDYVIKVTAKLTRSVDSDALFNAWETLPTQVQKAFKFKADVSITELRSLESMRDDLVPVVAQFVTTKPAKAAISITAYAGGN